MDGVALMCAWHVMVSGRGRGRAESGQKKGARRTLEACVEDVDPWG